MECLTKNIARAHHYCLPAKCATCPIYLAGEYDCFHGVDELLGDIVYETAGGRITVKAGFCFDGASIPQGVWSSIGHPFTPAYVRAALLHDVAYHSGAVTKSTADQAFRDLLDADGVSWIRRQTMFRAVSLFGGRSYHQGDAVARHFSQFITIEGNAKA